MKQSLILWVGAFVIALLFAFWNRVSSEEYPITGSLNIGQANVRYKFDKVYRGNDDFTLILGTDNNNLNGEILWRKEKDKIWDTVPMKANANALIGKIPKQNPLTVVEYKVKIARDNRTYYLPESGSILLKYYSKVPSSIMGFYLFTLFLGLIFSVRTGLDYFNEKQKIKKLSLFTILIWIANVMVFNPVKKTYELSSKIGTKILPITDLFDLPHVLLLLLWILGTVLLFNIRNFKIWSLILSAITLILFLFVH